MSFYTELLPFIDYIHSIRKLENYLSFDMKFPTRWAMTKSLVDEAQIVPFNVGDDNYKGISFVSQVSENEITTTLTKIAKVIKLNKEKELKEKLFKETIERLKQTFEKTDLEKLKNLYFDFEKDEETNLDINGDSTEKSENTELGSE